jgi:DNA-directed RNA polymerase specialized sigma24 family protein
MSRNVETAYSRAFIAPVLKKRVRPNAIAKELDQLSSCTTSTILKRCIESDKQLELSKEVLVTLIRSFLLSEDRKSADFVFLQLMRRVAGAISNKLVKWHSLSGPEMDDARQSIVIGLHEYFYSLDIGEELWECNFKSCFDLRLLTILGKLSRATANTLSSTIAEETDEWVEDHEFADPAAEANFSNVEVMEALSHLNKIDPKLSKAFYWKFFVELKESEIADKMEVTERSVRNWIFAAKSALRNYYSELER